VPSPPSMWNPLRVEMARRRLEETQHSLKHIAGECGFGNTKLMRGVFQRALRITPGEYRQRFQGASRPPGRAGGRAAAGSQSGPAAVRAFDRRYGLLLRLLLGDARLRPMRTEMWPANRVARQPVVVSSSSAETRVILTSAETTSKVPYYTRANTQSARRKSLTNNFPIAANG
jgi:Helix-turn-helix domain